MCMLCYKGAKQVSYNREKLSYLVGIRIRDYRNQRKMSQENLALTSGIHPDFLGKMERGERCPSIDTLNKVCDGLGIPMSQLLNFDIELEPSLEESFYRIKKVISGMPPDKAAELADIVENIIKFKANDDDT